MRNWKRVSGAAALLALRAEGARGAEFQGSDRPVVGLGRAFAAPGSSATIFRPSSTIRRGGPRAFDSPARRGHKHRMSVDLNGIAHIQLSVNDPARCLPFWSKLCGFFGMQTLISGSDVGYWIGSRTGILVRAAQHPAGAFDQERAGLHHFCFRARSREDVDAVHRFLVDELQARIVHPPEEGGFAPGYYSVLFEDPDGIRVEVNYVPGKGHLGPGGRLGEGGAGPADAYGPEGVTNKGG